MGRRAARRQPAGLVPTRRANARRSPAGITSQPLRPGRRVPRSATRGPSWGCSISSGGNRRRRLTALPLKRISLSRVVIITHSPITPYEVWHSSNRCVFSASWRHPTHSGFWRIYCGPCPNIARSENPGQTSVSRMLPFTRFAWGAIPVLCSNCPDRERHPRHSLWQPFCSPIWIRGCRIHTLRSCAISLWKKVSYSEARLEPFSASGLPKGAISTTEMGRRPSYRRLPEDWKSCCPGVRSRGRRPASGQQRGRLAELQSTEIRRSRDPIPLERSASEVVYPSGDEASGVA